MFRLLASAVLALTLCACAQGAPPLDRFADAATADAMVAPNVLVEGADLLTINGERIRLGNVTVPQAGARAGCWAEAALAVQSLEGARSLWARDDGPRRDIQRIGTDPDGRKVALVSIDGRDVGETLIGLGLAARPRAGSWDWCGRIDGDTDGAPQLEP